MHAHLCDWALNPHICLITAIQSATTPAGHSHFYSEKRKEGDKAGRSVIQTSINCLCQQAEITR